MYSEVKRKIANWGSEGNGTRLERTAENHLWLVLAGHEVGDSGHQTTRAEALDQFVAYCADPANRVWIDTAANIAAYVKVNQR